MAQTRRPLHLSESELLQQLLAADFPGRDVLRLQLQDCLVESIDSNGSLRFILASTTVAPVNRRIPVEAQCRDFDGVLIHALLHLVEGKLAELEFYKDDSSPVRRMPARDEWEVMVPG